MEKIVLPKEVAQKFCEKYNCGDWSALEYLRAENTWSALKYLRAENNNGKLLDWETECLLYAVCSMNTILNDYSWSNSLDSYDSEVRPAFSESWINDLENKYIESRNKLINRFSNIGFNEESGELEYKS